MNREQALRYFRALTGETPNRIGLPTTGDWRREERTLRTFLEAFPALHERETVYERFSRPPDQARLAAFKADLDSRQGLDPAEQSHCRWASAQFETALKPVVPRPPPAPEPVIPRPSSAQALWCAAAVERLVHDQLSSEERARLERELLEVIAAWDHELHLYTEDRPCPDCTTGFLLELDLSTHLRSCQGHPAVERLHALQEAARLAGAPPGPALRLPPEVRAPYASPWEARQGLEILLAPASQRRVWSRAPARPETFLTQLAREWAHFIDRTSDPCPWCGQVLPLADLHAHLRSCGEHPAERAAKELRRSGGVPVGLERVVLERLRNRRELALLSQASATFNSDMGWTGEAAYSDTDSERPWRAAVERAGKFLRVEGWRRRPFEGPSPVRDAANRLLSTSVTSSRADLATLRAAADQLDHWVARIGFGTKCPACQRKGLPRARLEEHLEQCPLHPAVRRARASAAVRQLREGVEVAPLALGKYDPEDYRDRIHDYLKGEREKALATLFELDPSEISKDDAARVLSFVADWEELSSVAANPPCPWCGKSGRSPEHLLACSEHPAEGGLSPRDELEALAVRLQYEADLCAVRLARLHEACAAFWNGMSDGDDGKSISNPRIEAMWSQARAEASATLAEVSE